MKKLLFLFITFLLSGLLLGRTGYVNVNSLNVRNSPNENSDIVYKLALGDTVRIEFSEVNNWYEVYRKENKIGFVDKRYVTTFSESNTVTSNTKSTSMRTLLLYLAMATCLIGFVYWMFSRKCPNCKKYGGLKYLKKDIIEKIPTKIKVVLKDKNSNGQIMKTHERLVPGTKFKYRVYYKCKTCGEVTTRIKTETRKN